MNKIAIITVNFNSFIYTNKLIDNIQTIKNKYNGSIELIIVDNASSRENPEDIKAELIQFEWIKFIQSESNVGYFRGLNLGISALKASDYDYIIVCNNDIVFDSNFFNELSVISLPEGTLVVAPRVTTLDGREQNPHLVDKISKFRRFCYDLYFANYYLGSFLLWIASRVKKRKSPISSNLSAREIYMGIGACYILSREFFRHCEKLDERIFLWGEEALLAGQVNAVNGKTMYFPLLRVFHSESASVSTIPTRESYKITQTSYKIYRQYLR